MESRIVLNLTLYEYAYQFSNTFNYHSPGCEKYPNNLSVLISGVRYFRASMGYKPIKSIIAFRLCNRYPSYLDFDRKSMF